MDYFEPWFLIDSQGILLANTHLYISLSWPAFFVGIGIAALTVTVRTIRKRRSA